MTQNLDVSKVIYRVNMQDRVNNPTKTLQGLQKVSFNAIPTYRRLCILPQPPTSKNLQYILPPNLIMSLPFYIQNVVYPGPFVSWTCPLICGPFLLVSKLFVGGPFNNKS
jgi:hypothetical protein